VRSSGGLRCNRSCVYTIAADQGGVPASGDDIAFVGPPVIDGRQRLAFSRCDVRRSRFPTGMRSQTRHMPVERRKEVGLAVTPCGDQFTIEDAGSRGEPEDAATTRGSLRLRSPPFLPLCGAPHNAERFSVGGAAEGDMMSTGVGSAPVVEKRVGRNRGRWAPLSAGAMGISLVPTVQRRSSRQSCASRDGGRHRRKGDAARWF
jgi:hypothetical protein